MLQDGQFDAWADLYADDAIHEFPFAPPGRPTRLEGRAAIAAHMRQLPGRVRFEGLHDLVVHEATDSGTAVAEFRMTGWRLTSNTPFEMTHIWVITFRDGRIVRFRDYMNPLAMSVA